MGLISDVIGSNFILVDFAAMFSFIFIISFDKKLSREKTLSNVRITLVLETVLLQFYIVQKLKTGQNFLCQGVAEF